MLCQDFEDQLSDYLEVALDAETLGWLSDHRQVLARARGEHQIERLRRRDENVGGARNIEARFFASVSPVRTPVRICSERRPRSSANY